MSLLGVVLTLIVVGVLLWLAEKYIPMDPAIKNIMRIVVIVAIVLWLLQVFGLWQYMLNIKMPRA